MLWCQSDSITPFDTMATVHFHRWWCAETISTVPFLHNIKYISSIPLWKNLNFCKEYHFLYTTCCSCTSHIGCCHVDTHYSCHYRWDKPKETKMHAVKIDHKHAAIYWHAREVACKLKINTNRYRKLSMYKYSYIYSYCMLI